MERRETNAIISDFHATNPFGRRTETTTEQNECRLDSAIAAVISEAMSDFVPSQEQNAEIAAANTQPNSSRASPDSTNLPDDAENNTQRDTRPPLEVTDYSLENWPNSNQGPISELSIVGTANEQNDTPRADPRMAQVERNPLGSQEMINSIGGNPFRSGYALSEAPTKTSNGPAENSKTNITENPLRYVFRTPPSVTPKINYANASRTSHTPDSQASADTNLDSTITKARKEVQTVREDFQSSLAQLAQVQTRLARENNEHEMRADMIMRDMDELRKGLLEMQAEGRQNQGRLEASMASLNDLIKQRETTADARMAEMSAIMRERDRQADERMKAMTNTMQRRDIDSNVRMADLMMAMQDLTLGVKAIVSQTPAQQAQTAPRIPQKYQQTEIPSTSEAPQPHYRTVAQHTVEPPRPPKLMPPATYRRDLSKASKMAKVTHTESRDAGTDPMTDPPSLDQYARGTSTSDDFYSAADETNARRTSYYTADSSAAFRPPARTQTFRDFVPRPVATSTQRKMTNKRNLEQGKGEHSDIEEMPSIAEETPDTPRTTQRQALAEAISTAMSKGLEPLLAAKESKNKPTKYRGTRDGNADGWMMLMKRHLEKAHPKATPLDKAWTIIEYLEHEARDYITNKSEAERDTDEKVFALLARRFGTGSSKIHIQQQFRTRNQNSDEDYMQYLDALEGLRSQGYPNEEVTVRRYEIMQRFIEGVRNFELKRNLALMYAPEQYVEAPPTVEALRFTVQQYLRMRGSTRSDNYPMMPPPQQQANIQQPNQSPVAPAPAQKVPQQQPPQPAAYQQQPMPPAAYRPQPQRACFNCGDPSHFVVDCPLKDRARKPVQQQVNSCHTNPTGSWICPSQPHGLNYDVFPASLPTQGTVAFCINCGRTEHSASECMASEQMGHEEQIRAAWYAPSPSQFDGLNQDDQVRVISVAEDGGPSRPVVVTCGEKQVLTTLEAPAPDCTETLISIHLLLSAEQKMRPTLTLSQLKEELCRNVKYTIAARPLPHFAREDETKLAPIQKVKTVSPVPVAINVDGVDMKFDAIVVLEGHFPQGLYLGRQELRCYNIGVQDAQGEARIDERASLVVAFGNTIQEPIPLYGMIDTGSGVSILSLKAYQKIASPHALSLLPYDIQLYAANGKTINTIGIAENVSFQLGGYTLRTNFIVIADHLGAEDFLLGRNFLRTYNVLVDLTAMRVTIRDPKAPRHFKPVHEVSDHEPSLVISTEKVVLGPYERRLVRAQIISQKHNEYLFRNVMIRPQGTSKRSPFVSEDTLTSVGDEGIVFIALRNTTPSENVTIQTKTVLGKAETTKFVLQPVAADTATEVDKSLFEQVNKVYTEEWLNETSSEYSSFAQNFLSSTEMSEEGLSESEKRAKTDPQLLKPIPGPDLSSVLSSWGEGARDQLASVLSEYDDLFMKHKADIGRCKIAKHRIELEPEAIPHREGARRMSPDKAAKANQEVRNLLALGLIQPSYSPWASGIVMVKKKTGELRFCCDFRPLNDVTVKDAFPLPRIDESLSRIGNAKIFTSIDLAWAFWQIPLKKRDRRKTAFACELGLFEWRRMPFGLCNASATFQRSITRALQRIQQRHGSVVMAYIDDIVIATETIEDHIVRIKEVFECLREAGFKMRAEKCDFMRTETKYLGRVVSSEGIRPDPEAVVKIQEWMPPRNKEELQSFLGFANYYRDFVPFHAAKVQPLQELLKKSQHFHWETKHQEAFDAVKEALANATALAAPNEDGRFVLDTDASAVAIAGILHQEQEHNGKTILRPIVFGSKSLTKTQLNYGAPKLEMYAVFYFIEKFHSYLAGREFTLRVDNQALSWLKTYSMDQAMIGRWIARLDQYNFKTIHRPRTQHRNVDGLSKRTNDYVHREKILEKLPEVSEGFNFMTKEDYEALPTVPYFDKHGRPIPNHPELPPEARAQLPLLYILGKRPKTSLQEPLVNGAPWYPQVQWEVTPTTDEDHRPTHILSITTKVPPARLDTEKPDPMLEEMPPECQTQANALRTVGTELHEHFLTKRGLKDLHLAQNRDMHLLALKKLMKGEPLEETIFPEDVQDFARRYFHQKKDLLFLNPDDILCVNYVPQQRALHVRPCMIVMPQLYQHEILYRAHDESGHQGVGKVLARVQERHTWPGIKRDIVNHIKHCLTCQQTKHPAGNPCYPLQNINSSNFNDLVQFDHLKLCKTESGNTGLLVMIDHFTKFAEAIPCAHDEYDAQTTAKIILNKWFARHGTPARMQSDNATNFTAEIAQELMKASQVTKVTSTPAHPRGNGLVERQNRTLLTLLRVYTSRRMQDWDEHIDGILGAYNSTRHATTGFSPYMLQHGAEKSIPLSFIYPEFAARGFDSKEEFVEHLLARQQEIHELVRRNTHQAQLRQKLKFDRHLKAKAHAVGEAVWVFCHIIPKGGTRKLIRAWRGPHKVTDVLQDGRLYVLDTGQKVHYERLKKHVPAPWDWAAHQPFGPDQNVAIIADPYVEESNEEIASDISQDSFLPEQLPEASFEMEPTGSIPPRTIQTRTQTALEQGIPRRRFSHFGYPSNSDSETEENEPPIQSPPPPVVFPDLDDLEPLYSDQEEIQPAVPTSLIPSPSGTSAPLLSNPSLTDTLSNFPLFGPQPENLIDPIENKPKSETENEEETTHRSPSHCSTQPNTTNSRGRPRGRPPGRRKPRAIPSTRTTTSSRTQTARPRRGLRARTSIHAPPRKLDRAMTLPEIPESQQPPDVQDSEPRPSSRTSRYQLRANRAPRYKCGTCGSRNCSCVKHLTRQSPDN